MLKFWFLNLIKNKGFLFLLIKLKKVFMFFLGDSKTKKEFKNFLELWFF